MTRITSALRPLKFAVGTLVLGLAMAPSPAQKACDPESTGLVVPEGFCAVVVARNIGAVRQITVTPSGDLYAALGGPPGGVLAIRDKDGDGKADERAAFSHGAGNDVEVHQGYVYFALNERVLRYRLSSGQLKPSGREEIIVAGLPAAGNHKVKSLAFGGGDTMFVVIGSATNSCQERDRSRRSPGINPCKELEARAGVWQFSASRKSQRFQDGRRFATGLRNALAITTHPETGALYAAVHGRDQLGDSWGFSDEINANNPGEELVLIRKGDDFGWPYCYYSNQYRKKVLAPEYGGDGQEVGRCASAKNPLISFPGHWAPLALAFYNSDAFGPKYKNGLFIAFHGSWNRAPLPQAGYRVGFVPFVNGAPTREYLSFATGAGGETELRPSGLAVGPDGGLYISADQNETIWKVTRR